MSRALLDSNIVIDLTIGLPAALQETRLYSDLFISIVTWIEVMAGAKANEEAAVRRSLAGFYIVPLTSAVAERSAAVRRERRIKLPDAIIQASAQVSNLLLVTRSTKDFPDTINGVRNPHVV